MSGSPDAIRSAAATAGRLLHAMNAKRDALGARGGPGVVAEAAWVPGCPPKDELADIYRELRQPVAGTMPAA